MRNLFNNSPSISVSDSDSAGFTLVEILIAILIFGLGLISAFVLSNTASSLSMRSKQEIIATNLLREQLELFKNIRDTNFLALRNFDSLQGVNPICTGNACKIEYGYAALWTQYLSSSNPVSYTKDVFAGSSNIPSTGPDWNIANDTRAHQILVSAEATKPFGSTKVRYCQDDMGRYRLDCSGTMKSTPYYGFILVQPLKTRGDSVSEFTVVGAFKITAYFATTEWGYREMSMSTVVTDFKK